MANFSKAFLEQQKRERIGTENYNKNGELMKVIDYINSHHVVIEFQDEHKKQTTVYWKDFIEGRVRNPKIYDRLGLEKFNSQGCLMKIIKYDGRHDVVVEFQDEYKTHIHSDFGNFEDGSIKNPYMPTVCNIGIVGNKYTTSVNGKLVKEYITWVSMLRRCYDLKYKTRTYDGATCCEEWLLYENFYEWLHNQENFNKWLSEDRSAIDKDILVKGNKCYSPDTCCLVPSNVNGLFIKRDLKRGKLPIGVIYYKPSNKYRAQCDDNTGKNIHLKYCNTIEEAFKVYKNYKENLIKQVAQEEIKKGTISKRCYDAMMNYEVEITD